MSVLSDIAAENYLKAIVKECTYCNKNLLTTGEVAKLLSVTPGTATAMVKKLEKDGYLKYQSYRGCTLTEKGRLYGLSVLRRHRLLETFLKKLFGMTEQEIHEEAEQMEHSVSEKLIDLIDGYLGYPLRDPHGAPIPQKNQYDYSFDLPLSNVSENIFYKIVRISGRQEQKDYCRLLGITEGIIISLVKRKADLGTAFIQFQNGNEIHFPLILLDIIFVEKKSIEEQI